MEPWRVSVKLIAQSAALLPAKPGGAAQLLMVALSRAVRLLPAPDEFGAVAASWLTPANAASPTLPWLLKASEVDELNACARRSRPSWARTHAKPLSRRVPCVLGSCSSLSPRGRRCRPRSPPPRARFSRAPPFEGPAAAVDAAAMFPPLVLPAPPQAPAAAAPAAAGDDDDDELLAYDDGSSGPASAAARVRRSTWDG